jgi:uncharacterized protein (DUF169 family)
MATRAEKAAAKAAAEAAKAAQSVAQTNSERLKGQAEKAKARGITTDSITLPNETKNRKVWVKGTGEDKLYAFKTNIVPLDASFCKLEALPEKLAERKPRASRGNQTAAVVTVEKIVKLEDKEVLTALLNKLSLEALRTFKEVADATANEVITAKKTEQATKAASLIIGLDKNPANIAVIRAALAKLEAEDKAEAEATPEAEA